MDKKKIRLRGGGWFNRVFTEDSALAKLLIDETIFFDGKDVGTDVRIVALGVNEYYSHFSLVSVKIPLGKFPFVPSPPRRPPQ